ncbi:WblV protein [Photorhabdus temperata subsp. temperata M1021]|nr:WblV protein [Photorhabdus temperata subsp. temperata M1021]
MIYGNISELSANRIVNGMVVMKEEEKLKTKSVLMNAQKSLIKKARIGDWEGNTIIGKDKKKCIINTG